MILTCFCYRNNSNCSLQVFLKRVKFAEEEHKLRHVTFHSESEGKTAISILLYSSLAKDECFRSDHEVTDSFRSLALWCGMQRTLLGAALQPGDEHLTILCHQRNGFLNL